MHISSLSILYLLLFICLISFISSHTPIWILATHGCSDIDKFYIRNLIVIIFSYKKMQKELRTKINSFSSFVLILQKTPLWNALISLHKAATQTLFFIHLFLPHNMVPYFYQDEKDYMCGQATCQFLAKPFSSKPLVLSRRVSRISSLEWKRGEILYEK